MNSTSNNISNYTKTYEYLHLVIYIYIYIYIYMYSVYELLLKVSFGQLGLLIAYLDC